MTNARVELESWVRVTVQVPTEDVNRVMRVVTRSHALSFGHYDHVYFRQRCGAVHFRPRAGARLGETGEISIESEELSFFLPASDDLQEILTRLIEVHPFEEPIIIVDRVQAARNRTPPDPANPNRWWNR